MSNIFDNFVTESDLRYVKSALFIPKDDVKIVLHCYPISSFDIEVHIAEYKGDYYVFYNDLLQGVHGDLMSAKEACGWVWK